MFKQVSRAGICIFTRLNRTIQPISRSLASFNHVNKLTPQQPLNFSLDQHRFYSAKQPLSIKTVEERIILILSLYDKINPEKLTMDSDFSKDLGLDSLDFVEVIMMLEDEFLFEIPDGDADRLKTPRDVHRYICDKEDVYE